MKWGFKYTTRLHRSQVSNCIINTFSMCFLQGLSKNCENVAFINNLRVKQRYLEAFDYMWNKYSTPYQPRADSERWVQAFSSVILTIHILSVQEPKITNLTQFAVHYRKSIHLTWIHFAFNHISYITNKMWENSLEIDWFCFNIYNSVLILKTVWYAHLSSHWSQTYNNEKNHFITKKGRKRRRRKTHCSRQVINSVFCTS